MRALIAVAAVIAALFIGAKIATSVRDTDPDNSKLLHQMAYQPIPTAPRTPQFAGSPAATESFELNAGDGRSWTMPHAGKYKFSISAEHNVSFGAGFDGDLQAARTPNGFMPSASGMICVGEGVTSTERSCDVIDNMKLYIFDGRTGAATAANIGAAVLTRDSSATERVLSPNRVTIRLSEWKCVNFCS